MPGPAPKPPEQRRRRNAPEPWFSLPASGRPGKPPRWPLGEPSPAETELWRRLWRLPVAVWWVDLGIEPMIVARYVKTVLDKPSLASLAAMEMSLGLTPSSMLKHRLIVEDVEEEQPKVSRYAHLRAVRREKA